MNGHSAVLVFHFGLDRWGGTSSSNGQPPLTGTPKPVLGDSNKVRQRFVSRLRPPLLLFHLGPAVSGLCYCYPSGHPPSGHPSHKHHPHAPRRPTHVHHRDGRLTALSAEPETIDWAKYNTSVTSPDFVNDMKDSYTLASKVEYPADQYVSSLPTSFVAPISFVNSILFYQHPSVTRLSVVDCWRVRVC